GHVTGVQTCALPIYTAFDAYVSDPRKPVPYTAEITTTEGHLFMVEDQRFVANRPDVLVYETDPLATDLTIAGPIVVNLNVATTEIGRASCRERLERR